MICYHCSDRARPSAKSSNAREHTFHCAEGSNKIVLFESALEDHKGYFCQLHGQSNKVLKVSLHHLYSITVTPCIHCLYRNLKECFPRWIIIRMPGLFQVASNNTPLFFRCLGMGYLTIFLQKIQKIFVDDSLPLFHI
jgi:hypothetical protein